jgi:hypothetical protein
MKIEMQSPVMEVVNVAEAARRLGACEKTLARKVVSSGIVPDAVLLLGTSGRRSPLFVASDLRSLRNLLRK